MTSVAGSADTFRWSAGLVEPGSYEASVDAATFCDPLEVGADGLRDARVEVPPPCEVEVRCVREDTGAELGPEEVVVSGNRALTERTWHVATESPSWDAIARCWRLRIPVGRIELTAKAEGLARERREVEVVAGTNEVVLRLQRKTGLTLIFRDGAMELPETWFRPQLEPLEKEESSARVAFDGDYEHGRYTFLRKAGRYTLKMQRADGYEPVPDVIVELEKGVVKEHVIELRRKP